MTKLEKKYVKKMVIDILKVEACALKYEPEDFDNSYAVEKFADDVSEDINFYIDRMVNRNVNQNVIKQLKHLNFALWRRNMHLTRLYKGW